jgi:hypothetical protein
MLSYFLKKELLSISEQELLGIIVLVAECISEEAAFFFALKSVACLFDLFHFGVYFFYIFINLMRHDGVNCHSYTSLITDPLLTY